MNGQEQPFSALARSLVSMQAKIQTRRCKIMKFQASQSLCFMLICVDSVLCAGAGLRTSHDPNDVAMCDCCTRFRPTYSNAEKLD
jgi:hypothetical protein